MKSGMPLRKLKNITKSYGNELFTLLICVYRPIEAFLEPSVMYFNIFYVN